MQKMKRKYRILLKPAFLLIAVMVGFNAYSTDLKQLEDSATHYYNKSNYSNAIVYYDSIISENYSSVALFLNAGNCYFQIGDLANALYHYEKALAIDPSNEDVQHNLAIANSKVKSKTQELPTAFYEKWFDSAISIMSSDGWSVLAIVLFALSLTLAGLYLFSRNIKFRKTGFIVGIITLSFAIISIIFASHLSKKVTNNKFAIVFEKGLVKSSPNEESNNLFELPEGIKVEITDSLDNWYNVKLSDGKQGWILSDNLKRI